MGVEVTGGGGSPETGLSEVLGSSLPVGCPTAQQMLIVQAFCFATK